MNEDMLSKMYEEALSELKMKASAIPLSSSNPSYSAQWEEPTVLGRLDSM